MLFPCCWRRCQAPSQSDVISLASVVYPTYYSLQRQVHARHTGGTVRKDGIASDALFNLKRTLKQGRDLRLHDNVRTVACWSRLKRPPFLFIIIFFQSYDACGVVKLNSSAHILSVFACKKPA